MYGFLQSNTIFWENTTETGRPWIQRFAWQLILAPYVNNLGHMACFSNQKGELTWCHSWAFGWPKTQRQGKSNNGVLCLPKRRTFCSRKVNQWKFFCFSLLALYITCDYSHARTTKLAMRKCVTTWVHLFGLVNKATWPKSPTSGAKINCHAYLWIRGLIVSIVISLFLQDRRYLMKN